MALVLRKVYLFLKSGFLSVWHFMPLALRKVYHLFLALPLLYERIIYRIRRTKWFYSTWTGLLAVAIGGFLGYLITQSYIVAITVVLALFFIVALFIRPFEAFLFWIAIAPILQKKDIDLGAKIPNLTFDRAALGLILLSLMMRKFAKRRSGKLQFDAVDVIIGFFVVISLLNVFVARVPQDVVVTFFNYMHAKSVTTVFQAYADHYLFALIAFYIARNLIDDQRKFNLVLSAIISISIYLVPIGVFEHFTGRSWFTQTSELYWADANRAAGPFENPAVYGAALGVCFILLIHKYFLATKPSVKFLAVFGLFAVGFGEAMTFTRSAWLSPILGFMFLMALYEGKRKVLAMWFLAGVVALMISLPAITGSQLYKTRISDEGPMRSRMYAAKVAVEMIKDKPFFGHGIGNFDYYKQSYRVYAPGIKLTETGATSHNTFLTIMVETGLLGFIPYISIFGLMIWRWLMLYVNMPEAKKVRGRQMIAAIGGAALCYLVTAFAIDMRFFRYAEYIFWVILALIQVQYALMRQSVPDQNKYQRVPVQA